MGELYRFEDATMLAHKIESVFEKDCFDNAIMQQKSRDRHDASENIRRTLEIYNCVLNGGKYE